MAMETGTDHIKGLHGDHIRQSEHSCPVAGGFHEILTSLGLCGEIGGTGS